MLEKVKEMEANNDRKGRNANSHFFHITRSVFKIALFTIVQELHDDWFSKSFTHNSDSFNTWRERCATFLLYQ